MFSYFEDGQHVCFFMFHFPLKENLKIHFSREKTIPGELDQVTGLAYLLGAGEFLISLQGISACKEEPFESTIHSIGENGLH